MTKHRRNQAQRLDYSNYSAEQLEALIAETTAQDERAATRWAERERIALWFTAGIAAIAASSALYAALVFFFAATS